MNKLISVVIPVYNASKYLKDCVLSVLKQDYPYFEIILVDDGSKDNSLELCHELEKTDKRIKVVHQENGGVSKARNTGIENASGDYLALIDSDDLIEENYLSLLLSHMKDDVSLVVTNYKHLFVDGSTSINVGANFASKEYSYEELEDKIIDDGTLSISPLGTVWAVLFDLRIIKDNNLRFRKVDLGEDALFTQSYFYLAKKSVYLALDSTPYIYRENETSMTHMMSSTTIDGVDKTEEIMLNEFPSFMSKETLDKQIQRRRVTVFITHMILLSRSKELTYKSFKGMYKNKNIHYAIKFLDLKKTKRSKRMFINLLKLRLVLCTYILFIIKYGR